MEPNRGVSVTEALTMLVLMDAITPVQSRAALECLHSDRPPPVHLVPVLLKLWFTMVEPPSPCLH